MRKEYAEYLLKKTKEDYNKIAKDFARSREFIPEDIRILGEYTIPGERILDLGCGNGRLYKVLQDKEVDYFGIDFSEQLIKIAKTNYPEAKFQVADILDLPFPNNFFDKVYSISVLHQIPSREFRLQSLKEVRRVLKPEGLLILRVWNIFKRSNFWKLFFKYSILKVFLKSKLDFFDVFLPWKDSKGKIILKRYFHCFSKKELKKIVRAAGFEIKEIWDSGIGKRSNIYLTAEK